MSKKKVDGGNRLDIYTDGGCRNNPGGVGSWAFIVVIDDDVIHEDSGYSLSTTNNRMEIMGIIKALLWIKESCQRSDITIHSDSMYCVDGYNSWMVNWEKNDWYKGRKKKHKVLNPDLWKQLYSLKLELNTKLVHVKGHSGNVYNDRADELCTNMMDIL